MPQGTAPLSKSHLIAFLQCQKKLWLQIHRPGLADDQPGKEATFTAGREVGSVARSIYDPSSQGTTIDVSLLGTTKALARTHELLKEHKPIFEAGFSANGIMAFADVILPTTERARAEWRMIEVKSSASIKDYHREDIALQAYVARMSGLPLNSVAIAHVDSKWVYPGNGDYRGLLVETDLTDEAFNRSEEVEGWIASANDTVASAVEPSVRTGAHCNKPYACAFFGYCNSQLPKPKISLDWIPSKGKTLKTLIESAGFTEMEQIPDDSLNALQLRVKTHSLTNSVYFNAAGAARELQPYGFPAFFLDFETINFAVPIWKGTRPYQQIPFQFSVHRLEKTRHLEDRAFLDLSGDDPSLKLSEALVKACEESGPIYAYNAGFEKGVIESLAARFPNLNAPLLAIAGRLVDLLPIAKRHYYHPDMQGKWSIKMVLPTIASDLRYEELKGVQNGTMAQVAFNESIQPGTSSSLREELKSQLLNYCKLDTYAMVRLWQHFTGRSEWRL